MRKLLSMMPGSSGAGALSGGVSAARASASARRIIGASPPSSAEYGTTGAADRHLREQRRQRGVGPQAPAKLPRRRQGPAAEDDAVPVAVHVQGHDPAAQRPHGAHHG